ncbi:alpha/beta hydrolase [Actinomadura sp. DC4]|uniref:alpha/beta fold hydrolase n=1 Tax=Actinomadura sp. DC4 TaxID=3055069 RepID=UPI0025B226A7|nr:alpha/beta hydrolase [Actinomadura sp. DC4]MDN3359074.1 alpha/beta hydrolase [Actinomadura sp. DC4]
MPFTTAEDGTRVYFEKHGDGPAVLFVHGSGGHHAAWWQQVAALRDRYTVITVDLRGFGLSDSSMEEFDARAFPSDILAVIEAAQAGRVLLVGQSIGAAAALKAAIARPESAAGVVLAHSLGGIDHPELARLVAADREAATRLPVLDRLLSARFRDEHPDLTFLFRQMGTFNTAKMADLRNLNADGPTVEQVVASGIAVFFLAGELDAVLSVATVERAARVVTGSHLDVVAGAPHSMYWEAPEKFNSAVERVLRRVHERDPETMTDTDGPVRV